MAERVDRHTAIEINNWVVGEAGRFYPNISFHAGSDTELPFPDNSFDLVLSGRFFSTSQMLWSPRRLARSTDLVTSGGEDSLVPEFVAAVESPVRETCGSEHCCPGDQVQVVCNCLRYGGGEDLAAGKSIYIDSKALITRS